MIKLTDRELKVIGELGDSLYTPEFVKEWMERPAENVLTNAPAALQQIMVEGYVQAVRRMIELQDRVQEKNDTFCIRIDVEAALAKSDIGMIMRYAKDGTSYWCNRFERVGDGPDEDLGSHIRYGGTVVLYDSESGKEFNLTLEKLLMGVKKWAEEGSLLVEDGLLDTYGLDAEDADRIIQYALFGEMIYG